MSYEFWQHTVADRLSVSEPYAGTSLMLPARTLSGVKTMRVGSIAFGYLASESMTWVSSCIEPVEPNPKLTLINSQVEGVMRPLVRLMLTQPMEYPFMIGNLAKADGSGHMALTYSDEAAFYCEPGFVRPFSLARVKRLFEALPPDGLPTLKKILRAMDTLRTSGFASYQEKARLELIKARQQEPALFNLILREGLTHGSADLDVLGMAYAALPQSKQKSLKEAS